MAWPAAVLAATLVAGFAATLWIDASLGKLDEPRIEERVRAAAAVGAGVGSWLRETKSQAEALARTLEPWTPGAASAARSKLDSLLRATPFDDGAFVVDSSNRVIATSTSQSELLGLPRDLPFARESFRGITKVSGIYQDPLRHENVVDFSTPLHTDAKVSAVLVAGSKVAGRLTGLLNGYRTDRSLFPATPGVRLLVVPPGEIALDIQARQPLQRGVPEIQTVAPQARADSNPGFFEYTGEGGVGKVAGYARASDEWVVVLSQDASDFYRFGTSFAGRLWSPGPTRTAGLAFLLIALAVFGGFAVVYRRLRRARAETGDAKRAFLTITGHELRTPLTSIRGFSQMLSSRWDTIPDGKRKELMQTIARQARNLERLVERLITGAQLEAGMGPVPSVRPADIAEVIEQSAEQFGGMSHLHTVETDIERPLVAEVDLKAFQEVLGHLIENAMKYSPLGGTVWVEARRDGDRVEVTVEDEGVGLPADISGIFDKFVQGESVDTRTYDEGGVGLGLYIVKAYLDRMDGTVVAERREPSGARFVVTLKAALLTHLGQRK